MIKIALLISTVFLFSSCSFGKKPNAWESRSSNNVKIYTDAYLSSNDLIARSSLSKAIKNAKQSDDLSSLATIYLGECALNISVGIENECSKYANLQDLVQSDSLDAYYSLIRKKIVKKQLVYLPKHYRAFATSYLKKDYKKAIEELLAIEQTSSALVCAALIKDELNRSSREAVMKRASVYGYKRAIIFWLKEMQMHSKSSTEISKIERKVAILTSKE
ncbi:MAG: hypothetical protein U9N39_05185 [Campylobacterota bacterium]|nr:hypothetical protein [Campylobacterota bacterium]